MVIYKFFAKSPMLEKVLNLTTSLTIC